MKGDFLSKPRPTSSRSIPSMRPFTAVTSLLSLNAVLENSTTATLPSVNAALDNSTTATLPSKPDLSLTAPRIRLNDTVSAKVKVTLRAFARAALRELQLTSTIGPTTDTELLANVRLLFGWTQGSVYVDMSGVWGTWESLRFSLTPFVEGYNALSARLGMETVFADALIKGAWYVGAYEAVDLKWPRGLRLGYDQPYHCFLMEGDRPDVVYVGVNDRVVATSLPGVEDGVQDKGVSRA